MRGYGHTFCRVLMICGIAAGPLAFADDGPRVNDGLLALYTFERADNGVIPDRSGVGEPLNLRIDKPQGVLFAAAE
jgi:hypothetical protein